MVFGIGSRFYTKNHEAFPSHKRLEIWNMLRENWTSLEKGGGSGNLEGH